MSAIAIRARGLGKLYRLGRRAASRTLREALTGAVRAPFGRRARERQEPLWALHDVSFDIEAGDVVGVIGRNGAGKSTLLKLLARITRPTTGRAELRGRVGTLLEVGTGFHPELTGRENIALAGAVLGMGRAEVAGKFDEIVAFAEVERFVDTPVKHYSSGMYLRLAFAVAAHLEPEILLVDEVLAVGDAQFQRKCLGRIGEVARSGRTVLFVSHDEAAIRRLCERTLLLQNGGLAYFGPTADAYSRYRPPRTEMGFSAANRTTSPGAARIVGASLEVDGSVTGELLAGARPVLRLEFEVVRRQRLSPEVLLRDQNSAPFLFCPLGLAGAGDTELEPGLYETRFRLLLPTLAAGAYTADLMLAESGIAFVDYLEEALAFTVAPAAHPESGWVFRQSRGQGATLLAVERVLPPTRVSPGGAQDPDRGGGRR